MSTPNEVVNGRSSGFEREDHARQTQLHRLVERTGGTHTLYRDRNGVWRAGLVRMGKPSAVGNGVTAAQAIGMLVSMLEQGK